MADAANPHIVGLKHLAFAVADADAALARWRRLLPVGTDARVVDWAGSRTRVAIFLQGGVEFQLNASMDPDGRFATWIAARGGEGLHHICYAVDDIAAAMAHATGQGATAKLCRACNALGPHPHPEGFVAFLQDEAAGTEVEFMQVYTPAELERYKAVKGI
jgi:methylmalonyl-CoA/ethylmalonyl-CoA epimerase